MNLVLMGVRRSKTDLVQTLAQEAAGKDPLFDLLCFPNPSV